ncbi:MAG TPA: zinc metalloprotease [Planctomycetaceae bacterium]|nr:zinc metalloprotease [Planctomycetaceae bacterium]
MRQTSAMLGVTASVMLAACAVLIGTPATPVASTSVATHHSATHSGSAKGFLHGIRICGTPELTAADVDLVERFTDAERRKLGKRAAAALSGPIPVAFHCVYLDDGFFSIGLLTQLEIQAQIDLLNTTYSGTGVSFFLASTSFTNNEDWFFHSPGSADERNMKLALSSDPRSFLNIYSTGLSQIGLLGYATFPWNLRRNPDLDGVVIGFDTLPGGTATPYDEGDTAVHEVGHWCGLYHTFQGGCSKRNDNVSDTPAESAAFFGCTFVQPDSCPAAGLDPIFNFMDYSDDACLDNFTAGQAARMLKMLTTYRTGL